MRNDFNSLLAALFVVLAIATTGSAQAGKQAGTGKATAKAPTQNLSGVWFQREGSGVVSFTKEDPPMQPWVAEKSKNLRHDRDDPDLRCLPPGVPRVLLGPTPMEIIQIPGRVLIVHENNRVLRQIWMDGRKPPEELEPSWAGYSVGKWDGDTLVIDTIGLTDKSWIDSQAHLHTAEMHVTERYRRIDHDTLQVDIKIDDPKAYTKPWGGQRVFKLHQDWQIMEHVCEDKEDYDSALGKEGKKE